MCDANATPQYQVRKFDWNSAVIKDKTLIQGEKNPQTWNDFAVLVAPLELRFLCFNKKNSVICMFFKLNINIRQTNKNKRSPRHHSLPSQLMSPYKCSYMHMHTEIMIVIIIPLHSTECRLRSFKNLHSSRNSDGTTIVDSNKDSL